jgi:plasmid maintenance system antidote protein VapI
MEAQKHQTPRPIRRIRRENLSRLISEFDGVKPLATRTGTTDTHLYAIQSGAREIGDELATKLEAATGKPHGWLDLEQTPSRAKRKV